MQVWYCGTICGFRHPRRFWNVSPRVREDSCSQKKFWCYSSHFNKIQTTYGLRGPSVGPLTTYFLCPPHLWFCLWHWPLDCSSISWSSFLPRAFILHVSCPNMLLSETLYSVFFFSILLIYAQICPSFPHCASCAFLIILFPHQGTITTGNILDGWITWFSSLLSVTPPAHMQHRTGIACLSTAKFQCLEEYLVSSCVFPLCFYWDDCSMVIACLLYLTHQKQLSTLCPIVHIISAP